MDIERPYSGVASVSKRCRSGPHKSAKALGSKSMGAVWIEDVPQEEAVADFLPIHPNSVKRTEDIERAGNLLKCLIIEEQPF
jgi:hypothetical protein